MKKTMQILIILIGPGYLLGEEPYEIFPLDRDECPIFEIQGCSPYNDCYPQSWLDDGECHMEFACYNLDGGDCGYWNNNNVWVPGDNESGNWFVEDCSDSMCTENPELYTCYDMLNAGANCFGCYAAYDCAEECLGTTEEDCAGACEGDALIDECGFCDGDGIPEGACDCFGSVIDECGICGGDNNWCSAPEAESANHTLDEDNTITIELLASDVDGDVLTFNLVSGPVNGMVELNGNAATYMPYANFYGEDSFEFIANDGGYNSNIATINFVVNPINDAPYLYPIPDTEIVLGEFFIYILEAFDVDGDDLSYTVTGSATATITNNVLTILADIEGVEEIIVTVSDGIMTDQETFILTFILPECADEYEQGFFDGSATGDVNGDGILNIVDIVQSVNMILNGE